MAKLIECYTNGSGEALLVSVDVTPSWWTRQKPHAFGIVAARIQKGFMLHNIQMGIKRLIVTTPLCKTEPLEPRVAELIRVLEELAGECALPSS